MIKSLPEEKKTKIVATVSDKNCSTEFLRQLYEAGMDVIRLITWKSARCRTLSWILPEEYPPVVMI